MAEKKIAFNIALKKNDNQYSPGYGQYYPEAYSGSVLSLRGLVERVAFDQSVYSCDIIEGVITKLRDSMVELLQSGQPVKWDGLGTFTPKVETIRRGLEKTDLQSGKANVNHDVAGIHIRFIPENSKGEKLTSRALKEECTFKAAYVVESKKKVVDGKERTYQEKIPISSFAVATHQEGDEL
jgi:predicted histone-like DNA-binding protein